MTWWRSRRSAPTWIAALAVLAPLAVPTGAAAEVPFDDATRVDVRSARGAAIEVSQRLHDDGAAGAVVLARQDTFPDALGASALTAEVDGPLLLTPPSRLAPATRDEIRRVLPDGGTVHLLGGTTALSPAVERELDGLGYRTTRFPGADRIETAAMVARVVGARPDRTALLVRASGSPDLEQGWVDSVSCGGYAADTGTPVLLTSSFTDTVDGRTRQALRALGIRRVDVCGGTRAVPASQVRQLRAAGYEVRRHAGETRADTAVAVATQLWDVDRRDARTFLLVPGYGRQFGYGLVAAPLAAALDAPILLVDRTNPTSCHDARGGATLCLLRTGSDAAGGIVAVGGTRVIADTMLARAARAAGLPRDTQPPAAPTGLAAEDRPEDDGTRLDLSWTAPSGEPGEVTYTVHLRPSDAEGELTRANAVASADTRRTTFVARGLDPGVAYDVAVDARDAAGNRSPLSTVVSGAPTDEVPHGPGDQGPSITARDGGGLAVAWSPAPEADVAAYELQRRPASQSLVGNVDCGDGLFPADFATVATVDHPTTAFADAAVDASQPWCYRYRVLDTTDNASPYSAVSLWNPS